LIIKPRPNRKIKKHWAFFPPPKADTFFFKTHSLKINFGIQQQAKNDPIRQAKSFTTNETAIKTGQKLK